MGEGGDDGNFADDPACFLGESLLLLANGSRIPLADASVGMRVTSSLGGGTITEVLRHPIGAYTYRFRLPTAHGPLLGTLDHPFHINGGWLEAQAAHAQGLLPGLKVELVHVDLFYNLEIDGDAPPGESAHAYDVNGYTVSGLGDNERLNALYPRQEAFKAKQQQSSLNVVVAAGLAPREVLPPRRCLANTLMTCL